jgi:hypothetical protein
MVLVVGCGLWVVGCWLLVVSEKASNSAANFFSSSPNNPQPTTHNSHLPPSFFERERDLMSPEKKDLLSRRAKATVPDHALRGRETVTHFL